LPQLAAAESALEEQIEKRPEFFPEGPLVPFPEAATKITGRSSRRAPDAFRKFLKRDRKNQRLVHILEKHGVPEKDISMYRTQFKLWGKSKTRPTEKKIKKTLGRAQRHSIWTIGQSLGLSETVHGLSGVILDGL
jgi:hypothetical protein